MTRPQLIHPFVMAALAIALGAGPVRAQTDDQTAVHIIEGAGINHGWADYRDHRLAPELGEMENFRYRYFAIEPEVRGQRRGRRSTTS